MARKREQLLGIMEDAAKGETKATLRDRIAELAAENERLRQAASDADIVAKHFQSERDHLQECLEDVLEQQALSRTGAVKVPAEASKEMIEDGVLAYNLTGIAGGVINTAEDHVTFNWNAMAAHLSDLEPAAPEGQQPVAEAVEPSGNTGELIDKMAEAIRGDTASDDTPWATLSEDRKIGWRGDAERALAVVKEYLTARRPSEQAVTEAGVEAAARHITKWLGFAWDGLHDGRVTDKGFPVFTQGQFGWGFHGHKGDMIDLARAALKAAMEAGRHE